MNKVLTRILITFVVIVLLATALLVYYEGSMWEKVGVEASPSGSYGVYEYQYMSDGDRHAPYGSYLFLAPAKSFKSPRNGYLIFAGHCKGLKYNWASESEIRLDLGQCPSKNKRTLSLKAYGVQINVE